MFLSIIYPSATATAIAKPCVVAAVVCEVPSAKVNEPELNVNPAALLVPFKFTVPVNVSVPLCELLPEKLMLLAGLNIALFKATTASMTSVADAIVPDAPVILAISPTSALKELNVVLKVSKVFEPATLLSAIFFLYKFN